MRLVTVARISLLLAALLVVVPNWAQSKAEKIAQAHINALNSNDRAQMHQWILSYCTKSAAKGHLESEMEKISQGGRHSFRKVVFDAPYEFIAEVLDSKLRTEHLTVMLTPEGKVRAIFLLRDR